MASLWWWMAAGMGFAFFLLDCPFWRPKIGDPRSRRGQHFFLLLLKPISCCFIFHPTLIKKFGSWWWIFFVFYRQVDGFAPTFSTKPTIRQDTDGSLVFHCSILADPRPVVTWFHNGDKIQDNKKFQVSRHSSPPQQSLSSRKAFDFLKCLQKASSMRGYFWKTA